MARTKDVSPRLPEPGDRMLWICFYGFGDVLEFAADAYNVKRLFPGVHAAFLTFPKHAELLRAQPYLDEVLTGGKSLYSEWWNTLRKIRAGRYKWVISYHGGGHSAWLTRLSGAWRRIGTCQVLPFCNLYQISLEPWRRSFISEIGGSVTDRSVPAIFAPAEDREAGRALLSHLPDCRLFAALGGGWDAKLWPPERWVEFLRPLVARGWGVVLNGHGPLEEVMGQRIEKAVASPNLLNLVGKLDFKKMAGVVHCCSLTVGNDTGPLHLAALSGVPALGLFNFSTSDSVNLRMPWFREFCASDHVAENQTPLKALPVEPVAEAFNVFAEEFLPKAFAWR